MKRSLLFVGFLLIAFTTQAAENKAADNLRTLFAPLRSLSGRFVQYEFNENSAEPRVLNGRFSMARPLKLFWEIDPPYAQTLVIDGEKIYIHDKDLNQVIIRPLDKDNLPPFFFLEGNEDILASMNISQPDSQAPYFFLTRLDSSQPEEFYIHFENGLPYELHWKTPLGRRILFVFQEIQKNPRLRKNLFTFRVPRGAEVIEETR